MPFWRRKRTWSDDEWRMHMFILKAVGALLGAAALVVLLLWLVVHLVF